MPTDANFLDSYFHSVYNKLEADALLFNRSLPHAGLVGSENENALADLLRSFLPSRFGVEVSGIVIDHLGGESRQCDIILYDNQSFPRYVRKVFPIETVYGVIEVKTNITSTEANRALVNLESVYALEFRPRLTNYWLTRSASEGIQAEPPFGVVFGYRSEAAAFETFQSWFPLSAVHRGCPLSTPPGGRPEARSLLVAALDKGLISMESTNQYIQRMLHAVEAGDTGPAYETRIRGEVVRVSPVRTLFWFLQFIWNSLSEHRLHPGFDIRAYVSPTMDRFLDAGEIIEPENAAPAPEQEPEQTA